MDCMREIISIVADIAGLISLIISFATLLLTARIRRSLLFHVEASVYRQDIDQQTRDLEAIYMLLLQEPGKGGAFPASFFTDLACRLDEIKIAYATILTRKVTREITSLISLVSAMESKGSDRQQVSQCAKQLNAIVVRLKKEKNML